MIATPLSGRSAITWSTAEAMGRHALSLVFFLALTRLLTPADIGLFAFALAVQTFAGVFVDRAVTETLVQRDCLRAEHLDAAFWLNLALAAALGCVMALSADLIAAAIGAPDIADLVRLLAPAPFIGALCNVQVALFQRRLNFRTPAKIWMTGQGVAGCIAVAMAIGGWGIWSLVANQIVETSICAILFWLIGDWRPRFRFEWRAGRDLLRYWTGATGARLFFFAREGADRLILGIVLGPAALGYYTVATRIVRMFVDLLAEGNGKAVLAIMSRMQTEQERLQAAFVHFLCFSTLLSFPAFCGLALVGPDFVTAFFGEHWKSSSEILPPLAIAGAGMMVLHIHSIFLRASGHSFVNLAMVSAVATLDVLLISVTVPLGLSTVAWALAGRGILVLPICAAVTGGAGGRAARAYMPAVICTAVMILVILPLQEIARKHFDLIMANLIVIVMGVLVYGAAVVLLGRSNLVELIRIWRAGTIAEDLIK
ncbi:lipopolysaccharide biosynthesis protein (plasmid) [Skermanella rosea]|uniref:lipopolysaccharide biosynthesis protein n=1 Tax=Skermanella rosea TaxID=1817965 RepID=UPI001931CA15|nr:lipopolysaccharide biosynthesis protein [Skermanella rosea]UEM07125.1 lipopolysaccharide biosynthesis protein [Skermanella rosea]